MYFKNIGAFKFGAAAGLWIHTRTRLLIVVHAGIFKATRHVGPNTRFTDFSFFA